jgi:hypothetical protein
MRTQDGHFIGSMWRRKNKDLRVNYGIAVSFHNINYFLTNKPN